MSKRLLTVRELAALWSVHPETIRRLCRRRQLAAVRMGRETRIREVDAEAYVMAHRDAALPSLQTEGRVS